jgi:hypothetical protein
MTLVTPIEPDPWAIEINKRLAHLENQIAILIEGQSLRDETVREDRARARVFAEKCRTNLENQ